MILKINGFKLFLILYAPILTILILAISTVVISDAVTVSLFHTQILFFVLWSHYLTRKIWENLEFKDELKFKYVDIYFKLTLFAFLIGAIDYFTGYKPENWILFWIGYTFGLLSFILTYLSLFIHYFILSKYMCMKESNNRKVKPWLTYITLFFFPFTIGEIQSKIRGMF